MSESSDKGVSQEPMADLVRTAGPNTRRPGASLAARKRARETVRSQLRAVARRHIAERGLADLSLRAIARELGMTSSAVYRYFTSRDELIGSLVVESYESMAEVTERADRLHAGSGRNAAARWLAIAREIRTWAHDHPNEYGLICGWPSTAHLASSDTDAARVRLWRVIAGVMDTALTTGVLQPPARPFDVDGLVAGELLASVNGPAAPLTDFSVRTLALVSSLLGAISAELFGPFQSVTTHPDRVFDLVVATGAVGVGLDLPVEGSDRAGQPGPPDPGQTSQRLRTDLPPDRQKGPRPFEGRPGPDLRGAGSARERSIAPSPRMPG